MCTVSYLPTQNGFILTSNRDESPDRGISEVATLEDGEQIIYFPKDPAAGGSWFGFSSSGTVACLLNGAYEPYDRSQVFPKSRGIILLESFKYPTARVFAEQHDLSETAPFTIVIESNGEISQTIWDGRSATFDILDPDVPHFWSSVTLYPEHVRKWRRTLFETWLKEHDQPTQDAIMDFHRFGGRGDAENDFVMDRNGIVKTLSISSVISLAEVYNFRHLNLDDPGHTFHCQVDKSEQVASSDKI